MIFRQEEAETAEQGEDITLRIRWRFCGRYVISVWLTTANKPGGALACTQGPGRGVATPLLGPSVSYSTVLACSRDIRHGSLQTQRARNRGREEKPSGARVTRPCVHGMPTCVWRFVRKMARMEPDSVLTKTEGKPPSFPLSGECKI